MGPEYERMVSNRMNVCIIGHTERNYLPYMEKYVRFFEENGVEYDIICWEREDTQKKASEHEFPFVEEARPGKFYKFLSYMRFRRHVVSCLKKKKYDRVIVLTTVPAIALGGYLKSHFAGRYLFDIRDYSFERLGFYRKWVNALIKNSALTTISSHGFMEFLEPNPKIIINHNITPYEPESQTASLAQKQVINIGFIGGVRYFDENTFLIDKLKNTFRYQLWYIGKPTPDCDLQSYCAQHEVTNVSFIGKFTNDQKPELYKSVDMINSIYGSDSLEVTTALPNRLYEACIFKKPIISSKGTYLGEVIKQYGLGFVVDAENDDILAIVNDYVEHFNPESFIQHCNDFLAMIAQDEENLQNALKKFIQE